MSNLVELEKVVAEIISSDIGVKEKCSKIRAVVQDMLADNNFVISCIERSVSIFEKEPDLRPLPPLLISENKHFAVHLIYWPPEYSNSPHMHSTWGVTGVFHNRLVVETYVNTGDLERPNLKIENRFDTKRGEVGYLLPSCIHRVCNEASQPSASFHLFGTDEQNQPAQSTTVWFGDNIGMNAKPRFIATEIFCDILLSIQSERTKDLLIRVFRLASNDAKLRIIKWMSGQDIKLAYRLSILLEQELFGSDKERLSIINKRLLQKIEN